MHPHHRFHRHFGHDHAGRGLGRFGRGFMDGSPGGRPLGMGKKLASADLQLLILSLLPEKPYHGYEIIKALDDRSKGFYVPSPGMVYPALTYLEEIGHATVVADGNRKLYSVTDAGREHLATNRTAANALFTQFERVGKRMDRVRQAMRGESLESSGGARDRGSREFVEARQNLKQALAEKMDSSLEEQQRIAGILRRATTDIAAATPQRPSIPSS